MSDVSTSQTTTGAMPCWYELGTTDLDAARDFYGSVLGWTVADSGMPDFDYRLASTGEGHGVAGMMTIDEQEDAPPPNWVFYLAVDDCDATATQVEKEGGSILRAPADIPGTGRYAICADPQGAVIGLLQPLPMEGEEPMVSAFDQTRPGHGAWHELSTSEPAAAYAFYEKVFGWRPGEKMDMGEAGPYQLVLAGPGDIGGIMGLMGAPQPAWLSYFGVTSVSPTIDKVTAAGGAVLHGPNEVPGGAWVAVLADPQGAAFGITGPSLD